MYGFGGGDTLSGGAGDDVLVGGTGNVTGTGSGTGSGQLVLNTDGTTDDHASVSNVTDFPTDALTFEMRFTIDQVPSGNVTFVSYAISTRYDEEFTLHANPGGNLVVNIHDRWLDGRDTGIPLSSLSDGEEHMLSVTWDSATGALNVYVDGVSEYSGTYKAGTTLTAAEPCSSGRIRIRSVADSTQPRSSPAPSTRPACSTMCGQPRRLPTTMTASSPIPPPSRDSSPTGNSTAKAVVSSATWQAPTTWG